MALVPILSRPTIEPNVTTEFRVGNGFGLVSGITAYGRGDFVRMFYSGFDFIYNFDIDGTIWAYSTGDVSAALAGFYIDRIDNSGTIAAEIDRGNAGAISVGASGRDLINSGTLYAVSRSGQANAASHWGTGVRVDNAGLIAALSLGASPGGLSAAYGLSVYNGADLYNRAGARILAEGDTAIAVLIGRGPLPPFAGAQEILNDGQIEAASTRAGGYAVAIALGSLQYELMRLVNNGLIKANIAISATGSDKEVTNSVTGRIEGAVIFSGGDDRLTNAGTLLGNVTFNEGNDWFANAGTMNGTVDFGWGTDTLEGGAGAETVTGGRDADSLDGGGGDDLLLGGHGNDSLIGGAGADGLYGEFGNDRIVTSGADRVVAGPGDDAIVLGDLGLGSVDGGAGFDSLWLPTGGGRVDIGALLNADRVTGIEQIVLGNDGGAIAAEAFPAKADGLRIGGGSSLVLAGAWSEVGALAQDGGWRVFAAAGHTLLVAATTSVVFMAALPGDLARLGPEGSAPTWSPASGIEMAPEVYRVSGQPIGSGFTVDAQERWVGNPDVPTFYASADTFIRNMGRIEASATVNLATAIQAGSIKLLDNQGSIAAVASGPAAATAVVGGSSIALRNSGTILASAAARAMGVDVGLSGYESPVPLANSGSIRAVSSSDVAISVQIGYASPGLQSWNTGVIEAVGSTEANALNIYNNPGGFLNLGTIRAEATRGSSSSEIAVRIGGSNYIPEILTNNGIIVGRMAILAEAYAVVIENQPAGSIVGTVSLGAGADQLTNRGAITGTVTLGGGNDLYDGVGGSVSGGVFGGSGDDSYRVDGQGLLLFEAAGEGNDNVVANASYYLYANIENLTLAAGAGDLFGVGNGLANVILGNDGANLLIGGAGDDVVAGGEGNDALFGEAGADSLQGDAGIDYLAAGSGNDRLDGGDAPDALYGEAGDDLLLGGSSFDTDILVGGDGNDTLDGASGRGDYDLLDGGAGDDVYRVDTPADLTFEAPGEGTDTVFADIAGAGCYLYANTENLILLGTTPFGVGNDLDNRLTGNATGNYLLGGAGNDTLDGGAGGDVLFGEAGADVFVFTRGTGGDVIGDFAAGIDRIDLRGLGFASFGQLQANFIQNGNIGAINLGNGDFIVLHNVTMTTLTASDFLIG